MEDTNDAFSLREQTCQRFTLAEIQSATHHFDEALVIGRGGFGKVYKTRLVTEVAIKRLHAMSTQGALEFEAEVTVLSKLRHGNLVSLVGYCNEGNEMALAYEFIPNGTLKDYLCKVDCVLSWLQRLKICVGAARGLDYLHTGTSTQHGVIHRDVKTSNILLDANLAAKISDFGLAKVGLIDQTQTHVSTNVKGTFGYMDPAYFYTGKLTRKSDVYAFGVVLFEVLTGRQAVDSTLDDEQWGLAAWAQDQIKVGNLNQIIDSRLTGQISRKCLKEFESVARHCLSIQPKQRPTMAEVVVKLESILSQERECAKSVIDEGGFMYKVRSFFTGKVERMPKGSFFTGKVERMLDGAVPQFEGVRSFTFEELKKYTSNFSEINNIGAGGYGEVYKGSLPNGQLIAIKRAPKGSTQGELEFKTEIVLLSRIHHKNVVALIGFCFDQGEQMVVYEYVFNGTLKDSLSGISGIRLDWMRRLKIALGAARGLQYLHDLADPPIIHRNVKTSNILLDERLVAKVADFVLSKPLSDANRTHITTQVKGTIGYLDPEYYMTQQLTVKSDVYSFGVVMLEQLTSRKPIEKGKYIVREVKLAMNKNKELNGLQELLDPAIGLSSQLKGVERFVDVALTCVEDTGDQRPSMSEVVKELESILELVELNPGTESSSSTSASYEVAGKDYNHPYI